MKTDHNNGNIIKKGWTAKNTLTGLGFLFVGFIIWFLDSVVAGVNNGITGKNTGIGFWGDFGFALMAFGVLGYWTVIPAYQKWWKTKRWAALIFIIPGALIVIPLITVLLRN